MRFFERELDPETAVAHVRQQVIQLAQKNNPWLLHNHLFTVEQIAQNLLYTFPSAANDIVILGVFLHDIGKFSHHFEDHEIYASEQTSVLLNKFKYPQPKIEHIQHICLHHDDIDCPKITLEEKIVRTADATSHLIQPGFIDAIFEESLQYLSIPDACDEILAKLDIDFNHRIAFDFYRNELSETYARYKNKYETLRTRPT